MRLKFEITYRSSCIWKVRVENNKFFHSWPDHNETLVRSMDGNHLVMINILEIDVLPSLRKSEVIELRMAAFATEYRIFEDENAYAESIKPGIDGKKPLMERNTIFPVGQFVQNHWTVNTITGKLPAGSRDPSGNRQKTDDFYDRVAVNR